MTAGASSATNSPEHRPPLRPVSRLPARHGARLGSGQGAPLAGNPLAAARGESTAAHRAARWKEALARLQGALPEGVSLPGRICVFGISALPPYHLQLLDAVSRSIDVNLFVLNPCREYWYLIYSDREMRRLVDRLGTARSDETLHLERGNSLLASMGSLGRDFLRMVYDTGCEEADFSAEPGEASLLACIQSDILNLRDRGEDGTGRPWPLTTTRSRSTPATAPCGRWRSFTTSSSPCSSATRRSRRVTSSS